MIKIDQTVREFLIEARGEDGGCSFHIDAGCRFNFRIGAKRRNLTPTRHSTSTKDLYLRLLSDSSNVKIELSYVMWLKKGNITSDKISLRKVFGRDGNTGSSNNLEEGIAYYASAVIDKFLDSHGMICICFQIKNASVLMTLKSTESPKQYRPMFNQKAELCDCTIRVENKASKYVLAGQSEVLAAMWMTSMIENDSNEMKIEDFDAKTVENMLNYMHSFGADFPKSDHQELYLIADKYQIYPLKEHCLRAMSNGLTTANFTENIIFAFVYEADSLKQSALEYARADRVRWDLLTEQFIQSKDYEILTTTNCQLATQIMRELFKGKPKELTRTSEPTGIPIAEWTQYCTSRCVGYGCNCNVCVYNSKKGKRKYPS